MYTPPAFRVDDLAEIHAAMRAARAATLVTGEMRPDLFPQRRVVPDCHNPIVTDNGPQADVR